METQESENVEAFVEHLNSEGMETPSYEGASCFGVCSLSALTPKVH